MKIKETNYITILAFMVTELKLKGNELLTYAIIHGFSQTDAGWYEGSLSYLMEWVGCSKPTIIKTIQSLIKKGLLEREERTLNGNSFPKYRAIVPSKVSLPPVKKLNRPRLKNLTTPGKKTLPNINNNINKNINTKIHNFDEREYADYEEIERMMT